MQLAEETLKVIQDYRNDAEKKFKEIFNEASLIANRHLVNIKIQRIVARTQRLNIHNKLAEEYYCISVFIPYVESFINELKERFIDHKTIINAFHSLFTSEKLEVDFIKLTKYYQKDIESGNEPILNAEYKL